MKDGFFVMIYKKRQSLKEARLSYVFNFGFVNFINIDVRPVAEAKGK